MLKRLIAFMAVLAMVAGVAFGQASLGGQLMIGTTFLEGDTGKGANDIMMGGLQYHEAKISASFGDDKGGGKIVLATGTDSAYLGGLGSGFARTWGYLFWRPIQQFRMQVGVNADGDFGAAQISGWGFTGEAKNSVAAVSDYQNWGENSTHFPLWQWQSGLTRKGQAWYPGTGDLANVNFSFFPMYGMQIHFVLPIGSDFSGDGKSDQFQSQIADFQLNVKYDIEEIGLVNVAFVGKGGLGLDKEKTKSVGNLYASFYLKAIEGIGAELGLNYSLPYKDISDRQNDGYIGIGAGFSLNSGGPFTLKFRANVRVGGKDADKDMDTLIYANILPCYKINNNLWAFLYAGIGMEMKTKGGATGATEDYARLSWFVNPYIWVRASEGLRFWTGIQFIQLRVNDKSVSDPPVEWRVPFGFNFYF